jgi:hypothetical protein
MRLLMLSLALLAWSGGPIVTPKPALIAAAPQQESTQALEAEFDALHAQARAALERLRQAQTQRLAMANPAAL